MRIKLTAYGRHSESDLPADLANFRSRDWHYVSSPATKHAVAANDRPNGACYHRLFIGRGFYTAQTLAFRDRLAEDYHLNLETLMPLAPSAL